MIRTRTLTASVAAATFSLLILGQALAEAQTNTTSSSSGSTLDLPAAPASSTTESTTSKESLRSILGQKKFADDSEITDTKLKAEEGSRSQYSLKFNLSYAGAPIDNLGGRKIPNPDGSVGTYATSLGGDFSGRLRLSPESAISVGSGLTMLTPFQGVSRYDTRNPFLGYDLSSKWRGFQLRNSFTLTDTTNPDYNAVGETSGASYSNSAVYNLPDTNFALALDSSLSYWFFNRGYVKADKNVGTYFLSFYPYLKYNATSKLNINTSLAIQYMNPRVVNDPTVLQNKTVSERLALGYAFSKDIYFSPYINFYPASLNADSTTLNFSTTFSIL